MLQNVLQRVDVAIVYIQIGIGRELLDLLFSGGPLVNCRIQLVDKIRVSTKRRQINKTNNVPQ